MSLSASSSSLLFMRHGATALNAAGLRCGGDVDLPLTELGHLQSVQAAQHLAALRPRVGVIVVSALQRTRQTAEIIGRALHGVEVVIEPAFNERRLGEWNRRPIAETQAELAAGITPPGGESNAEFTQRVSQALRGIEIVIEPAFNERRLGEWNRRPIAETQAELAAGITPPGGESNAEFTRRISDAVAAMLLPLLGQRPLLIASKGVARVLGELCGQGPGAPLDNAGIVAFDLSAFVRRSRRVCAV